MSQDCKQQTNTKPLPDGYAFYRKIGSPKFICAPMVEQSELPFRLLCRKYNIPLCYTPMINSKQFLIHSKYAESVFQTCLIDRPLIAQFCGNDPDILLSATKLIQHKVDAIDINFGCPQAIAKRGYYGAFLLNNIPLMCRIINKLHLNLNIPVCAKIRILQNENDTLKMCKLLQKSGCSLLTVHGRTINNKKQNILNCNFNLIKKIKNILNIPVIANGGCETVNDVYKCLLYTKCDGYMAAESLLSNPSMFIVNNSDKYTTFKMTQDYINECKLCHYQKNWITRNKHVPIKGHIFKILQRELTIFSDLRYQLGATRNIEYLYKSVDIIKKKKNKMNKYLYQYIYDKMTINYYNRHRRTFKMKELKCIWDKILNECTQPIEDNQNELILLLIKYNVIQWKQLKIILKINDNDIDKLKDIYNTQQDKQKKNNIADNNADNDATIINSMFGMHLDDDDDDDTSVSTTDSIIDID